MGVTLHSKRCNFTSRWSLFCIVSSNDLFGSQISNIFLPHIEWVTFCRREFYIPYENQLHSLWEYTSFFTGIHFILVRNEVYSRIEHKILSAGNKYFPGLKILYSRQESIAINVRNKIKAISMGILSILNHLFLKAGVNHHKCRRKISKIWKLGFEENWLTTWKLKVGQSTPTHPHQNVKILYFWGS